MEETVAKKTSNIQRWQQTNKNPSSKNTIHFCVVQLQWHSQPPYASPENCPGCVLKPQAHRRIRPTNIQTNSILTTLQTLLKSLTFKSAITIYDAAIRQRVYECGPDCWAQNLALLLKLRRFQFFYVSSSRKCKEELNTFRGVGKVELHKKVMH